MSCYQCSKTFGFLNKEVTCFKCRYSFCSGCLKHKLKLPGSEQQVKVCRNCSLNIFKKSEEMIDIPKNLQKLKENNAAKTTSQPCDIEKRLKNLSSNNVPQISTEDLEQRLHNLKGNETSDSKVQTVNSQFYVKPKSDQSQIDDLLSQMQAEIRLNKSTKTDDKNQQVEIERRLMELKGESVQSKPVIINNENYFNADKIIEKVMDDIRIETKTKTKFDDFVPEQSLEELSFCCLCTEDARWRCFGCDGDLYCDSCYRNCHKKSEYGPHRHEEYKK